MMIMKNQIEWKKIEFFSLFLSVAACGGFWKDQLRKKTKKNSFFFRWKVEPTSSRFPFSSHLSHFPKLTFFLKKKESNKKKRPSQFTGFYRVFLDGSCWTSSLLVTVSQWTHFYLVLPSFTRFYRGTFFLSDLAEHHHLWYWSFCLHSFT